MPANGRWDLIRRLKVKHVLPDSFTNLLCGPTSVCQREIPHLISPRCAVLFGPRFNSLRRLSFNNFMSLVSVSLELGHVRCHHVLQIFWNCFTVEDDDATIFFEMLGSNHLSIQCNIPDDLNAQKYRCGHFGSHHSVSVILIWMCLSPVEMWWHTVTHGRGSEGETGEWSG